MDADIKGCLNQIKKSYRAFTHDGKSMTKDQVKMILTYGLTRGYKYVSELSNEEIKMFIK